MSRDETSALASIAAMWGALESMTPWVDPSAVTLWRAMLRYRTSSSITDAWRAVANYGSATFSEADNTLAFVVRYNVADAVRYYSLRDYGNYWLKMARKNADRAVAILEGMRR